MSQEVLVAGCLGPWKYKLNITCPLQMSDEVVFYLSMAPKRTDLVLDASGAGMYSRGRQFFQLLAHQESHGQGSAWRVGGLLTYSLVAP